MRGKWSKNGQKRSKTVKNDVAAPQNSASEPEEKGAPMATGTIRGLWLAGSSSGGTK